MLIQDFIQFDRPFAEVRDLLLCDVHSVLDANISAAYNDGELLCMRLQPARKHPRFGKKVWVDIGEPYSRGDGVLIPVHWWANGATHLFPSLDGDLEVMPIGGETTQITLMGRYDPPLGGVGQRLDKMLLHRLAETSVRSFLTRLAAVLEKSTPVEVVV